MSQYPKIPTDVIVEICTVGELEYVCFKPEEISKIALWAEQVQRWHKEVQTCKYVKEYTYENTMYKIMESFPK